MDIVIIVACPTSRDGNPVWKLLEELSLALLDHSFTVRRILEYPPDYPLHYPAVALVDPDFLTQEWARNYAHQLMWASMLIPVDLVSDDPENWLRNPALGSLKERFPVWAGDGLTPEVIHKIVEAIMLRQQ
ncbi:hypothetical protein KKB83_03940 [Patescibacteria group bacterium]|nr:hypothetical protein [Patescibacteria group bacterium]